MAERKLMGVCVVCRKDIYRDPLAHYLSRAHGQRVRAWDKRNVREQRRRREAQEAQ